MTAPWTSSSTIAHVQILLDSFRHWLGQDLIPRSTPLTDAEQLFQASFAVLSHGTQSDPILNYGNATALQLWEMEWDALTQMPSRLTAEPELQQARSQQLALAAQNGYVTNFEGVRISKTGQRFLIQQATLWKLLDAEGNPYGQAATFSHWQRLP